MTIIITKNDLDINGNYLGDLSNCTKAIEIEANLGVVKFKTLKTTKHILARAGSGIETGWSIKSGESIEAGSDIKAGKNIEADKYIEAGLSIEAGENIEAKHSILAGVCWWREIKDKDLVIKCKKLISGTIKHGKLIETFNQ